MGCFATQLYEQQNFHLCTDEKTACIYSPTGPHTISISGCSALGIFPVLTVQNPSINHTLLSNSTRNQIYSHISQNPGVGFRALATTLCLPVGLAEYHLGVLVRSGLVSFVRDGRYKRFFVAKRFGKRDMALICLLRHDTARRILETLLSRRALSHGELADEVAISSQALTWQMKTLKNTTLMVQVNDGLRVVYSLNGPSVTHLQKCLSIVA